MMPVNKNRKDTWTCPNKEREDTDNTSSLSKRNHIIIKFWVISFKWPVSYSLGFINVGLRWATMKIIHHCCDSNWRKCLASREGHLFRNLELSKAVKLLSATTRCWLNIQAHELFSTHYLWSLLQEHLSIKQGRDNAICIVKLDCMFSCNRLIKVFI